MNQVKTDLHQSTLISVDTETNRTELDRERYCLGISIATDRNTYYIPVGHRPWNGFSVTNVVVRPDLFQDLKVPLVAHNWKFDAKVLRKLGLTLPTDNLWCTMMMSVYIDENYKGKGMSHELADVAPRYLGKESQKEVGMAKAMKDLWEDIPPNYMGKYAEVDARLPYDLYSVLKSKMEPAWIKQWDKYDRDFMLLLMEMEELGVPIDREMCEKLGFQCETRLSEIRQELGFDPAKPTQLHPKLFSDPPFGLGLTVPSYTPKDHKPQVGLEWLQSVGHPTTALVYEYRKTSKQLSSYFSAYLKRSTRDYARLHPYFKQHGTVTGRLTCSEPNLEQIPREEYKNAEVKKVFLPEEGKQLWEVDFRTIEFRLMAVYCKNPALLKMFREEGDLHQLVADEIGVDRHTAKNRINYPIGFGAGGNRIAKELGKSVSEGYKIFNKYRDAYPELFDKMEDAQRAAEAKMEISMWNGRKRHFRFESECRKAFNSIIQGGAFEIVKRGMLNLRKEGMVMSNQVHDSVWIQGDSEAQIIEAQRLMEDWTEKPFGLKFSTDRKLLKK
jgi:DNA polymerase-1